AGRVVFDVKCGTGAFLPSLEEARTLARELVETAHDMGRNARALLTGMEEPLGLAIGNANETAEAFALLRGEGPPDLAEVTRALAVAMLVLAGIARERFEAEARLDRALDSGEAIRKAESMVQAQHGDPHVVEDSGLLPRASVDTPTRAKRGGYVVAV